MMALIIGGIVLKSLLLFGILFLATRHEAEFKFFNGVWVTFVITLGSYAMDVFLVPALAKFMPYLASAALTFLIVATLATWMVVRFCKIRLWKGIVIMILFLGFSVGISLAGTFVTSKISPPDPHTGSTNIERKNGGTPALTALSQAEPIPTSASPPVAEQATDQLPDFALTPEWQTAQAKIKVSAVLVEGDGRHMAMVNGKVLGVGDVLTVEIKKKSYRFKMADITTDWVAWDPLEVSDSD